MQVETRLGAARLPAEVETALYRIVQEALTNAVKHAGASHVSIVVDRGSDQRAGDDRGRRRRLRPRRRLDRRGSVSLGMRERVELLDGTFAIDTAPGAGRR